MIRFIRNANRLIQHAIRALRSEVLSRLSRARPHRRRPARGVDLAATVTVTMRGDLIGHYAFSCQPQPGAGHRC